jgi:hypothetical protein
VSLFAAACAFRRMMKQPTGGDLVQRFAVDADLMVRVNTDDAANGEAAVVDFKELWQETAPKTGNAPLCAGGRSSGLVTAAFCLPIRIN